MANFAIHDGTTVVNVIIADSKEIAEEITGLQALETTGEPWISWVLVDGEWIDPNPAPEFIPEEPVLQPELETTAE
jgi:hypothetical protein